MEQQQITGTLQKIIYQKEGFIIGLFDDDKYKSFNALGTIVNAQIGLKYALKGEYINHSRFGSQFKFNNFETLLPSDPNGIFKYIVRICKFVGPSVGNQIIKKYGGKTLQVLKTNPEKIAEEIKGITFERAKEIQTTLLENEENEKVTIQLESMLNVPGLRKNLISQLLKDFKSNAPEIIKDDPYILIRYDGISFILADKVAISIGIDRDSPKRKRAAIIYMLDEILSEGHTWTKKQTVISKIWDLIQLKITQIDFDSLIRENVLSEENDDITFYNIDKQEKYVASVIKDIIARK